MKNKTNFYLVLTSLILIFSACKVAQPTRVEAQYSQSPSSPKDWNDYFWGPTSIDSFKILHTGSVKVPLEGMLNENKLPENHGLDPFLWVDVFAYLFHHKDHGWFLIDTGLDSSFQKKGNIRGLLAGNYIKDTRQEEGQNIGAHLARENKDIQGIFLTHLHGDHTAGLPEIDASIPKYIGKGETYIQIPLLYRSNHLEKTDTLYELDWEKGLHIAPFESAIDIFGDASFWAIYTPGHSDGHMSYLLCTENEIILLTGDASHTKYGFENGIEPGWMDDRKQGEKSLAQLRKFKELFPQIRVIYGHEL